MKNWSAAMQLVVVGLFVALCLLIPTGVGFWLGREMAHKIMFPLIGLGVGSLVMIYGVYRMVKPFLQETREKGREEQIRWPIRMLVGLRSPKQRKEYRESR
ncbi:MAG: hypothetical protein J7K94_00255 [Dehalococcoidia bacterium]|nr:hypothetical protein [Dehalococcoidia bacterium]